MENPRVIKDLEADDARLSEKKKYVKPAVDEHMELPPVAATNGLITPAGPSV